MGVPMISFDEKPNIISAPLFQSVIIPFKSFPTIASLVNLKMDANLSSVPVPVPVSVSVWNESFVYSQNGSL